MLVSGIAASVAGASLLSTQTAPTTSVGTASSGAKTVLLGPASPSTGAPLSQQTQDALAALKTLSEKGSSAGDAAKGAAMQKLATLKAQLKTLMMMGGDPKQRAKEAAAIARQIAAAAQAYAQAGGDTSTLDLPAAGSGTEAAPASDDPASSGATAGAAPQAQSDASASPPAAPPSAAAAPASTPTTPAATATSDAAPADGPTGAGAVGQGQAEGSPAPSASAATAGSAPAKCDSTQMDQAFILEARTLAQQAKAIIKAAEQALKLQHRTVDPTVAGAGDAAVDAVGAAANQIDASSTGGYDGSAPAPSAPAISITA
jgi:hypothetical protein